MLKGVAPESSMPIASHEDKELGKLRHWARLELRKVGAWKTGLHLEHCSDATHIEIGQNGRYVLRHLSG